MDFTIKIFEVTIRRNRSKTACFADWKNYDSLIIQQIIAREGCRPPYYIWNSSLELCSTMREMEALSKFGNLSYLAPCQGADKIVYDYQETELYTPYLTNVVDKRFFDVAVGIQDQTFKLIERKQAYSFQNLIGNGGGYVGLFLGNVIK